MRASTGLTDWEKVGGLEIDGWTMTAVTGDTLVSRGVLKARHLQAVGVSNGHSITGRTSLKRIPLVAAASAYPNGFGRRQKRRAAHRNARALEPNAAKTLRSNIGFYEDMHISVPHFLGTPCLSTKRYQTSVPK